MARPTDLIEAVRAPRGRGTVLRGAELALAPINCFDGAHDRFNERPADMRLM